MTCLLVYNPHEYYRYTLLINPSYSTYKQLANELGHHLAGEVYTTFLADAAGLSQLPPVQSRRTRCQGPEVGLLGVSVRAGGSWRVCGHHLDVPELPIG